MSEKKYCGSARVITTQYGDLTKISLHKDDINTIVKWMKENNSEWINFAVKEKREKIKGKPTHYCEIDEWKPEPQQNNTQPQSNDSSEPEPEDDLPF